MATAQRKRPLSGFSGNSQGGSSARPAGFVRPESTSPSGTASNSAADIRQQLASLEASSFTPASNPEPSTTAAYSNDAEALETQVLMQELLAEREKLRALNETQAAANDYMHLGDTPQARNGAADVAVAPYAPSAQNSDRLDSFDTGADAGGPQYGDEDGGFSIWLLPYLMLRNLWLVILTTVILAFASLAYVAVMERDYHASVELLLDPGRFEFPSSQNGSQDGDSIEDARVDSEVYSILSTRVLRQVVVDLDLVGDPALDAPTSSLLGLVGQENDDQERERRILETVQALDARVDAGRLNPSFVIVITARHPEPDKARDIANAIASTFLKIRAQDRRSEEEETANALSERASELLQDLTIKEQAVEDWKNENGIVTTSKNGLISDQKLEQINQQIVSARVELARAEGQLEQVQALATDNLATASLPEFALSPTITSLRNQLSRLVEQEAELDVVLGPRHPQRQVIATKKTQIENQLSEAISRLRNTIAQNYERAEKQVEALVRENARQQADSANSGSAIIELEQRQREAAIALELYQDFQNSAQKLREQASVNLSKVRLVSAAETPLYPAGPSKLLILASGLAFGALLGVGLGMVLELLRGSLLTTGQITSATRLPVIATLATRGYNGSPWWLSIFQRIGFMRSKSLQAEQALALEGLGTKLASLGTHGASSVAFVSAGGKDTSAIAANLVSVLDARGYGVVFANYRTGSSSYEASHAEDLVGLLEEDARAGRCSLVTNIGAGQSVDLIVIDAGQGLREKALPQILNLCDRTLLTVEVGSTSRAQLSKVARGLLPWRSKLAGVLSLGVPL